MIRFNKIVSFKILMLLLLCSNIFFSQTNEELKEWALRDAKITSEATLKMDFETVFKHTYPSILTIMGGKEKAMNLVKATFTSMKEQGFVFEKADILSVSDVVFENNEYRCYIEGYNQMKMNGMRIKSESYLLGIYSNDKKIWYFLEAKKLKDKALLDKVLPNFKTNLKIPDDVMTTEQL